jgi:NAD(P)-dependent dehydrogenase (short-subunit alcohol dehydrogenase family)
MLTTPYRGVLIVGAGLGLGASLARAFTRDAGLQVIVAARGAKSWRPLRKKPVPG